MGFKNLGRCFAMAWLSFLSQMPVSQVMQLPGLTASELPRLKRLYSSYQIEVTDNVAHTQHRRVDGSAKYVNALIKEDSPYLKQHAHNPVNWYPWGEEAFARARAENKAIFLSIGYSTCHWCHVMARETFDDEEIAEILNRSFISTKVDREQQPDIDEIYMTGVQLISGRGGWPMSNFLTPEGKPFFGATYYPPRQFARLLQRLGDIWVGSETRVREEAETITAQIESLLSAGEAAEPKAYGDRG